MNNIIKQVESMFEAMRQTLAQRITSESKFNESTRNFLLDKVCALQLK